MRLDLQDKQTLASLLPEEIALCFIMVKLCFPEVWPGMVANVANWGIVEYIGQRWFRDISAQ